MSSPTPEVEKPSGAAGRNVNPVLKVLMILFAVPAMLIRKSQQALSQAVYSGFAGGFRQFIGVVLGLGAGIGAGYLAGWVYQTATAWWVLTGIAALLATYVYVWPLCYLGVVKPLGRLSEELWKAVGREDDKSWVSHVLMFVGYASIILGGMYLGYEVLTGTKSHIAANWGWFSWLAWPAGIVAGILVGLIAGAIAWAALHWLEMALVAVVVGAGTTYLLRAQTAAVVTGFLSRFGLPAQLVWVAFVLEFALVVAYLFPLLHVILTHALGRFFKWLGRLPEKVYGHEETRSDYRQFFAQVVNIAGAYQLAKVSLAASAYFAFSTPVKYGVLALVALASYTLIGQWLRKSSNRLVGVIAGVHAVAFTFLAYRGAELWFGVIGAVVASAIAALLTYYLLFPLGYVIVRFVTTLIPVSKLGKPLAWLHAKVYSALDRVVDELGHAFDNTYSDTTPYRELFLHVANLGAVVGVVIGALKLFGALGFAAWLSYGLTVLMALTAYLLIGKLLVKVGNGLVGTIAGLAGGVASGTIAYAYLPSGGWWLVLAVVIGLAGLALTGLLLFPLAYVVVRAIVSVAKPEKWARPVLVGAHTWSWNRCADLWQQFVETYRSVEAWFSPIWQNFAKTWDDTWQSVKDWWEQSTGGKK